MLPLLLCHNQAACLLYCFKGELKVVETGDDVYESLDKAVLALEKKLRKYGRPAPMKKDYRHI